MNTNRVTLEDQLQRLEGLKTMLEDIRHNLMTYLITQPKDLLDSLHDALPISSQPKWQTTMRKNFSNPTTRLSPRSKER